MTNLEKIREMPTAAFADWLINHITCGVKCPAYYDCDGLCMLSMIEWLMSEVKG